MSSDPHGDNETVPHLTGPSYCRSCGTQLVWGAFCSHCASPGRLAFETYSRDWVPIRPAWEALTPEAQGQWAEVERAVIRQHLKVQSVGLAKGFGRLLKRLGSSKRPE